MIEGQPPADTGETGRSDRVDVVREQLLARITGEFQIRKETLRLDESVLEYYCVAEPESLLDEKTILDSHGELKWQPYWAQNWDAANGVSIELSRRHLVGQSVLDLGCGLGVTGAVAAMLGANVTLGDNAPPALLFAEANCLPWRHSTRVRKIDWRSDRLDTTFDLIVGSDILYDREDVEYLDRFWRLHLKPAGTVLLGDPNRPMTREYFDMLKRCGWNFLNRIEHVLDNGKTVRVVELQPNRIANGSC